MKLIVLLWIIVLAGCAAFKGTSGTDNRYHTHEFQIALSEGSSSAYVQGFVIDTPSQARPTQVVLWRSNDDLTADRLVHSGLSGVSLIDNRQFTPRLDLGSGFFTLGATQGITKLPIPAAEVFEVASAFGASAKEGFAAVRKVLDGEGALQSLNTYDRLE